MSTGMAVEKKTVFVTSGISVRVTAIFSIQTLRGLFMAVYTVIFWILTPFHGGDFLASSNNRKTSDECNAKIVSSSAAASSSSSSCSSFSASSSIAKMKKKKKVTDIISISRDGDQDVRRRRNLAMKFRGFEGSEWKYSLFVTSRGDTLFTQSWTSLHIKPKAVVVLLHGLNEYSGRYIQFAKKLNLNGFKVYGMDWIGHGGSDGLHGFVPSMNQVVCDTKEFISKVRLENPNLPYFLFGHSTGGSIVLKTALDSDIEKSVQGVVMTSPALRVGATNAIVAVIAPIIALLFPRYQCTSANKEGSVVSRDREVLLAKYSDPLVYTGAIRIRTGYEILQLASFLQINLKNVRVPFFVLHGKDDTITEPAGSEDLYSQAASQHKAIRLYEGLLHDLLFEPEKETIMNEIIQWLNRRLDNC